MKKFAWSWSKLKNYRTCPKRHYHVDLAKDFSEVPSEELKWGNMLHDGMANFIGKGMPLPKALENYRRWPELMRAHKQAGAVVSAELKLAMTAEFKPSSWFGEQTWFRGVVDVQYLAAWKKTAAAVDWKTGGKIQPEMEQLSLNAQLIFVHHPTVEEVITAYQWVAHDTETVKIYRRTDMTALWTKLMPEVRQMEEAARTMTYPPKPSGLCIRHCPVTSCPYHGRGSR